MAITAKEKLLQIYQISGFHFWWNYFVKNKAIWNVPDWKSKSYEKNIKWNVRIHEQQNGRDILLNWYSLWKAQRNTRQKFISNNIWNICRLNYLRALNFLQVYRKHNLIVYLLSFSSSVRLLSYVLNNHKISSFSEYGLKTWMRQRQP